MKKMILGLLAALIALSFSDSTHATRAPYSSAVDARFNIIEADSYVTSAKILDETIVSADIDDGTIVNADLSTSADIDPSKILQPVADGLNMVKVARASFVCTTNCDVDTGITSGVEIPAKAIIIRSYFRITTQFVDGGSGTIALSCEDANNIKTATDITGSAVGAIVEGESTGAASAFVASIAADCDITLTAATAEPSAGALTVWVHYVVHD